MRTNGVRGEGRMDFRNAMLGSLLALSGGCAFGGADEVAPPEPRAEASSEAGAYDTSSPAAQARPRVPAARQVLTKGRGSYELADKAASGLAAQARYRLDFDTEAYARIDESAFRSVADHPLSTFAADVDTASYANVRRFLSEDRLPPADAVRIEELVNYFTYAYAPPDGAAPLAVYAEVMGCPWAPAHRLVRIGLEAKQIPHEERPPANLVFLVDVSGSMEMPDKLPLVKSALRLLVEQLREGDRVALVVYAGSSGLVLPP